MRKIIVLKAYSCQEVRFMAITREMQFPFTFQMVLPKCKTNVKPFLSVQYKWATIISWLSHEIKNLSNIKCFFQE